MAQHLTRGTYDDGRHFLGIVGSSKEAYAIFDADGLQGGGYTWVALVPALARLAEPPITGEYQLDAEGDGAYVEARDPAVLDAFAAIIERAMADPALLRRALAAADPDVLE